MSQRMPAYATSRPDFKRANRTADSVLRSLNFPAAPIGLEDIAKHYGWKIRYDELHGPHGWTSKVPLKNGNIGYVIWVATDLDNSKYSEQVIRLRQRYTVAHEMGHILMHSHIDWSCLTDEEEQRLEVEAHWFASRLLMPDYIFETIEDMEPNKLAEKCGVNFQAAEKRIEKLDKRVVRILIEEATEIITMSNLGEVQTIELEWNMFQLEVAATSETEPEEIGLFCLACSEISKYEGSNILPIACFHCGAEFF
ncbi:ImmA/IrrE family metallo-endopeptidase [Paenibacillus sp. LHD-117]|uniref:ImmA/IrrE family metallo-endopeptidase n=1 Tax=Paenibacillus sp. LHD-117 TaxID=3071412 RepID=UPI0027E02191|nr:ImmA/IrrE family metallo-endopeptidase [Paenibacillus sp. LHD-117]MDQ6418705.1 ImmA/IrrE family metallo-endopeptidase [Paenibacillus sp. LHD-117]